MSSSPAVINGDNPNLSGESTACQLSSARKKYLYFFIIIPTEDIHLMSTLATPGGYPSDLAVIVNI